MLFAWPWLAIRVGLFWSRWRARTFGPLIALEPARRSEWPPALRTNVLAPLRLRTRTVALRSVVAMRRTDQRIAVRLLARRTIAIPPVARLFTIPPIATLS